MAVRRVVAGFTLAYSSARMLDLTTGSFLALVVVIFPALGILSYRHLLYGRQLPPKRRRFLAMMAVQVVLLATALEVANRHHIRVFASSNRSLEERVAVVAVTLFALAALLTVAWRAWKLAPEERRQRLLLFLPEKREHLPYWIAISLLAGTTEEIAYRGVLYLLLVWWLRNWWIPILIASVLFAVAHMAQGPRALAPIFVFAVLFHLLVILANSLYPAMAMHVGYDLLFGLLVARREMQAAAARAGGTSST